MIGLHMIVKDEERLLRPLLLHLQRWVDEMVIVDTGSRDSTRKIIREFAPYVFRYDWDMDFSAARNYGLSLMKAYWIFHVDADEWPTLELLRWINEAMIRGFLDSYDGLQVVRENMVNGQGIGKNTYEWHTRLFRRGHQFQGRIHEAIDVNPGKLLSAPSTFFLNHHKTEARQQMQNDRYEAWQEQRAITQARRL